MNHVSPSKSTGRLVLLLAIVFFLSACRLLRPGAGEPEIIPPLTTAAPPDTAVATLGALLASEAPPRDLIDLTQRYKGLTDVPRVARDEPAPYQVGEMVTFWYKDHAANDNRQVDARLVYRSDQLNLWLEAGEKADETRINQAAAVIEQNILPTNRAFFGHEWQPGVDGDNRVNILHLADIGGTVAGYFSQADEFVTAVNPFSNEREMLYINLKHAPLGSESYYHVIAHEVQHMIHWYTDSNEDTWLNEGLSELANTINGYPSTGYVQGYARRPDTQLNQFSYQEPAVRAHYGAAFLMASYFLDRFGETATRSLVQRPENGLTSVELVLAELGSDLTFNDLFADWLVANYLDGRNLGQGIFQYSQLELPELAVSRAGRGSTSAAVHQYGADYLRLPHDKPATLVFTGTRQVNLLPTMPYGGDYFWSSYPADGSNTSLTGAIDLTGLESANLTFRSWYDLEEGWDYGYLAISDDNGHRWQLLETDSSTLDNPQGNSYGPGYTGVSGGGSEAAWVQETADLTPFAGRPVLIRFEVVTDDAVHHPGWAIDDIAIPELGFLDDGEAGSGLWQAAGFVHHGNILAQQFLLQLIVIRDGRAEVHRLTLDEAQRGRWTLPRDPEVDEVILIVAGVTPVTNQRAAYIISLVED
jgi:immune inhibitor A